MVEATYRQRRHTPRGSLSRRERAGVRGWVSPQKARQSTLRCLRAHSYLVTTPTSGPSPLPLSHSGEGSRIAVEISSC